ncbi:CotH kinase family protein [bacterium]|nr:CotH kinase family protein [bacterium]
MNRINLLLLLISVLVYPCAADAKDGVFLEYMNLSDDGLMTLHGGDTVSGLYQETELRTIYLEFAQANWWQLLTWNYITDTDIPANLIFEGVTYPGVGVRFRGNTSYMMVMNSLKKSFNITIDYTDPDQKLMGYKTLNLLNSNADASFLHEVLFFTIARNYIPCPKANFVKLVINGVNWGVYINSQQDNSDLIDEWFLSDDGDRWKAVSGGGIAMNPQIPDSLRTNPQIFGLNKDAERPNQGGGGNPGGGFASGEKALMWLGSNTSAYQAAYELKTAHSADPWASLIRTCDILNNYPLEQLPDSLVTVMDVDRWLWFLAVENVFADDDGYLVKGADYLLYFEPESGRLHPIEHDGNESFLARSVNLSPYDGETNVNRPVISRLLAVPEFRQRYNAHVRTIISDFLDWAVLEPKISAYRALIEEEVKGDSIKLYSDREFENSFTQLENFVTSRRSYLLSLNEINRQAPVIISVSCENVNGNNNSALPLNSVAVTATIGGAVVTGEVNLYYASGLTGPFLHSRMFNDGAHGDGKAGDGTWGGFIPSSLTGAAVRYYIEARASDDAGTTAYSPSGAEHDVYYYSTAVKVAEDTPVVINEFMALNKSTIQDPQGDYDDWIELKNVSTREVDLTGMYLSDSPGNPRKWAFPEGTTISPGAWLIIWADEDGGDEPGLHANFKLSGDGESILLVDTDDRSNQILDSVEYETQEADISYGRYPDGGDAFITLSAPTPASANESNPSDIDESTPQDFILKQNFPNPFNNSTMISFTLPEKEFVELDIYSVLGHKVGTAARGYYNAGSHNVTWDGRDERGNELASGIYFYRLKAGIYTKTCRMMFLR